MYENLIIITSAINILQSLSVFNTQERFIQTLYTIESIKKKFPECFILLVEITDIYVEMKNELENKCNIVVYLPDKKDTVKSIGETYLMLSAIEHIPNTIKNIYKISGRYYLTDNFNLDEFKHNKYNFLLSDNCYHTTFYSIPISKLDQYKKCIILSQQIINTYKTDIEHALFSTIPKEDINIVSKLNCRGIVAGGWLYDK
jgi:hypothetical protein